jgi:hypothetical protein
MRKKNADRIVAIISILYLSTCSLAYTAKDCNTNDANEWVSFENLPCWIQNWKEGTWTKAPEDYDNKMAFTVGVRNNPNGKVNGMLFLYKTDDDSIRIINAETNKQKLILSPWDRARGLSGEWRGAASTWSPELIRQGDLLLIACKQSFYVTKIINIYPWSKAKNAMDIDLTLIANTGCAPKSLSLTNLKWKRMHVDSSIPLAQSSVEFQTFPANREWPDVSSLYIIINYSYYYGYSAEPYVKKPNYAEVPHIAVLHNPKNQKINVASLRFKTWEDGLGSDCNSVSK